MSGCRDDGTVADNKAYHSNRRPMNPLFQDEIPDEWDPGDIAEANLWKRRNLNTNLGLPENYEGSYGI